MSGFNFSTIILPPFQENSPAFSLDQSLSGSLSLHSLLTRLVLAAGQGCPPKKMTSFTDKNFSLSLFLCDPPHTPGLDPGSSAWYEMVARDLDPDRSSTGF